MASRPTKRGGKPQNKCAIQPKPQNAAKGRSLPNIAQGRPVAIAIEQFMQPEDRIKVEQILEWFEKEKAQYASNRVGDEDKEEIILKAEQMQNLVDQLNLFDINNEIKFEENTKDNNYFRINSTEYVLFDQKITVNSVSDDELERFREIVGELFLIEVERQKLIGDHKALVKTFSDLHGADLLPTVSFNLRKFRQRGLLEKLRAGDLIGGGFGSGHEAFSTIEPSEWRGEWEFDESADSAFRESPELAIEQLRIFTSSEIAAATPHNERGAGRKPRDGMADIFGLLVLELAENGYPGLKEKAWELFVKIAEEKGVEPLSFPQFRKQAIERLGATWWNHLGKDDPDLK